MNMKQHAKNYIDQVQAVCPEGVSRREITRGIDAQLRLMLGVGISDVLAKFEDQEESVAPAAKKSGATIASIQDVMTNLTTGDLA